MPIFSEISAWRRFIRSANSASAFTGSPSRTSSASAPPLLDRPAENQFAA